MYLQFRNCKVFGGILFEHYRNNEIDRYIIGRILVVRSTVRTYCIFVVCFRLPEVHGLLQDNQLGLGRVRGQVHVAGPRRDDQQPVGRNKSAGPMLVSDAFCARQNVRERARYYFSNTAPPNVTTESTRG